MVPARGVQKEHSFAFDHEAPKKQDPSPSQFGLGTRLESLECRFVLSVGFDLNTTFLWKLMILCGGCLQSRKQLRPLLPT